MAVDKVAILAQIEASKNQIDNLIDSDDLEIALASKELFEVTDKMLDRLRRAGLDVTTLISRNKENIDKVDKFIREFS